MPEDRRYHYISSAVVTVVPGRVAEVSPGDCAPERPRNAASENGRIVVVMEGEQRRRTGRPADGDRQLDGVIAANMVFEHVEEAAGYRSHDGGAEPARTAEGASCRGRGCGCRHRASRVRPAGCGRSRCAARSNGQRRPAASAAPVAASWSGSRTARWSQPMATRKPKSIAASTASKGISFPRSCTAPTG